MAKFNIMIDMSNDSFAYGESSEVSRILKDLAERIERNGRVINHTYQLFDSNGNRVGVAKPIDN